ncbi:GFA family protein [Pseudomonas citronellolis]|uniref:GFA family protein n=1 Tax=Pseudomonas citronellolis TaxID=53408 RepID=UPI0023E46B04|nr:GFA family protein [Pseudomonas citronellolis]MDF3936250.1 GFA family protein [Pseudomonas citronellolis]
MAFTLEGELPPIQVCHCGQCRKAQGGPFATNLAVRREHLRLLGGAEQLRAFESSPGKRRWFCGNCGSPIYSERDALPEVLRLRAGTLDGDLLTKLEAHYHVASAANWWPLDDQLPRHPAGKPG